MSVTTAQVGNLHITTQVVHTANSAASNGLHPNILVPETSKYFKRIPVKALSALLMLIGILQLSMGIMFYVAEAEMVSLTLKSGVYIWGGLVVFVAGVTSLIAFLKDTINMIKVCIVCNTTNILVAVVGLILFVCQAYYETQYCWNTVEHKDENTCPFVPDDSYYQYYHYDMTSMIMKLRLSMNIVIILFSLLGLIISCFMTIVSNKVLNSTGYGLLK